MSTDPYNSLLDSLERTAPRQPRAPKPVSYDPIIEKHASAQGLDPDLLRSVIHQESGGRASAVSPVGAQGLMQLMPATAQRFGVTNPHDPDQNIGGGAKYLRFLLDRYQGDVPKALAGYNAGEGNVDKYKGIPPFRETRNYVRSITSNYKGTGYRQDAYDSLLTDLEKTTPAQQADPYDALLDQLESSPATSVPPQSPEAGTVAPTISQAQPASAGVPPPSPLGYLDETQERPEDFPSLQPPQKRPDIYTTAGRAQRDVRQQAETQGGALYRVPVGSGGAPDAVKQAVGTIAKETDIPEQFVETWLKGKGLGLYERGTQKPLESSPTGYAAIPTEMIGQMKRDYSASLSLPSRAVRNVSEVLSTQTPGEMLLGTARELKRPVTADPVTLTEADRAELAQSKQLTNEGQMGGEYERALVQPFEAFSAGLGTTAGNLVNVLGRNLGINAVRDIGVYLQRRGEITQRKSQLRPEGEVPSLGPEIARYATGAGLSIAELVLLKRASGLPLPIIMAGESIARDMDKPAEVRAQNAVTAFGSGLLLDKTGALGRLPAAIAQTGLDVGQGVLAGDSAATIAAKGVGGAILGGAMGGGEHEAMREAIKPEGDPRVLGDLTRRTVPESTLTSLPDIPIRTPEGVRVVKRTVEPGVSEAVPTPESLATGRQASNTPTTEAARPLRQRFQHRDFGLVEVSDNQAGVPAGKVRVTSTADGAEHVIQKANGRGQGNSLAVPVREARENAGNAEVSTGTDINAPRGTRSEARGTLSAGVEGKRESGLLEDSGLVQARAVQTSGKGAGGASEAGARVVGEVKAVLPEVEGTGRPVTVEGHHGTRSQIEEFDPSFLGHGTQAQSARKAFFFASNEGLATDYADMALPDDALAARRRITELEAQQEALKAEFKAKGGFAAGAALYREFKPRMDALEAEVARESARIKEHLVARGRREELGGLKGDPDAKVVTRSINFKNPLVVDFEGKPFREETYDSILARAQSEGRDGVIFKNTFDPASPYRAERPTDVYAVLDKSAIGGERHTAPTPDRLSAPVPGPRAFRAQMKSKFNLNDAQADAVTELTEARARAWAKENGRDAADYYVERFGGIVRGGEPTGAQLNQTAWHGSPHEFDRFRLDDSTIGTGEGAQAYGHGLYFTDSREIGQFYKDKLSKMPNPRSLTDALDEVKAGGLSANQAGLSNYRELLDAAKGGDAKAAVEFLRKQEAHWQELTRDKSYPFKDYAREQVDAHRKFISAVEKDGIRYGDKRGALYKVDLAPEEADYLLWDRPLSEQSPKVKAALRKAGFEVPERRQLSDRQVVDLGRRFLTSNRAQDLWREDIGIRDAMRPAVRAFEAGDAEFVKFARSLEGQKFFDRYIHKEGGKNLTGEMVYRELQFKQPDAFSQKAAGQAAASAKLRELGIRGIKYLAGDSRAAGEGSHNYVIFDDADVRIQEVLRQQNKAAVEFMQDGRAVLRAFQKADVSSAVHELSHVFRRDLPENLLRDAEEAIGVKDGKWARDHEEKFARGFERYLKTGEAPTVKLRRVYESFKTWLTEIYGAVRGKSHALAFKPNERLVSVFDRMLGGEPKGEYGQLIRRLHEAPDEGTPSFFENAQVKRAAGLRPDATTADVRAAITEQAGKPRSSHLSPEDVKAWTDSKGLRGAAREALDFAVGKYRETKTEPVTEEVTDAPHPTDTLIESNEKLINGLYAGTTDEATFAREARRLGLSRAEAKAIADDAREFRRTQSGGAGQAGGRGGETQRGGGAGRVGEGDVGTLYQSAPSQTETPEFKRFFRGSKVVDEKGEPLVVYHGTNEKFTEFDPYSSRHDGFFFTSDVEDAKFHGENVIPAYVRLKNPLIETSRGYEPTDWLDGTDHEAITKAKERGRDGVIIRGTGEFKGQSLIVAFEPTQIKSVNNRGTFDPSDPNILYQSANPTEPSPLTPAQRARAAAAAARRKPTFREQLADVANVPRSLKSSIDLSAAMRQGAMYTLTHPFRASRIFFGAQLRSLSNKGYEAFKTELAADPDVKLMKDSGLHLTSLADGQITNREEAFASRLAGKIPLVKRTENAYVTFLDAARSQWFKQLKTQAEDAAQKTNRPLTKEQYQSIARFVNRATGRGDLGRGAINDAAPLLNSVFFAPRYAVSKLQVLDPRTYSQLPPGARRQAMRQAVQYFATVGATAALLKYGFGAQVGTDPESADFLKVKVGNTRYDLTAGSGSYLVFASRVARNLADRAGDKEPERNKGLEDNVKRFLRYKLAPVPAAALNAYQKRDAVGKETSVGKEALGLITPLYLQDLYEAFKQEGAVGLAKTAPGFVGVGVQTYSDTSPQRPNTGRSVRPSRPARASR